MRSYSLEDASTLGADPTLQNEEGKTALQVAEEEGREEVVELLGG